MKKILAAPLLFLASLAVCQDESSGASVATSIGSDGTGKIVVEARGTLPEPATFYSLDLESTVEVGSEKIIGTTKAKIRFLQGDDENIRLRLRGPGQVVSVTGDAVLAWAVGTEKDGSRFLEVALVPNEKGAAGKEFAIKTESSVEELPSAATITHFAPVEAVTAGFSEVLTLRYVGGTTARVTKADGFLPAPGPEGEAKRFQTQSGGELSVQLNRSGAQPAPVELNGFELEGALDGTGDSVTFRLRATASVSEAGAAIPILSEDAAIISLADSRAARPYRLRLADAGKGKMHYELVFPEAGEFPVLIDFVAAVRDDEGWSRLWFDLASGTVAPVELTGLPGGAEIRPDATLALEESEEVWTGFLPASGQFRVAWKQSRMTGEGKLFFSTSSQTEASVGAGLLRQDHRIECKVLQGELDTLEATLLGEGEVLSVEGQNVAEWTVSDETPRRLSIRLGKPLTGDGTFVIRTQRALGDFPVRFEPLRVIPEGAVRHSGFLRFANRGSVRVETFEANGLTQLAPEQFPGGAIEARQVFVYRFPAGDYSLALAADRIQPETSVSHTVVHRLADADRILSADIELDVREAPIREFDILVPADYSVVSVTGAAVADSVAATETDGEMRNVKILFGSEVSGRQLVRLQLEKNEATEAGDWALPRLQFPDAESVRGDIGVAAAAGFRVSPGTTEKLTERPLAYFPQPVPDLQQAFRIRERDWTATIVIEKLDQSVTADVFHLHSLSEGTAYGSVLVNYFVTGAPISELRLSVPENLGNVSADGRDVRGFRVDDGVLAVSLHRPVIGAYTLLVTFEESLPSTGGTLQPGRLVPLDVQGERGFVQIVSPMQVSTEATETSENLLALDALELPAEFRLLSSAPSLAAWQYTSRPFQLTVAVEWFEPGRTVGQVVEFSEIESRVSPDGEVVSDIVYFVKTRGRGALGLELPASARLWSVTAAGQPVTARKSGTTTLIPLPGAVDPNQPIEVRLRLGRPAVDGSRPVIALPPVDAPVLKTEWTIQGHDRHRLVPVGGNVAPAEPVLPPTGFARLSNSGLPEILALSGFALLGLGLLRLKRPWSVGGVLILFAAAGVVGFEGLVTLLRHHPPAPLSIGLPVIAANDAVEITVKNVPRWGERISLVGICLVTAALAAWVVTRWKSSNPTVRWATAAGGILLAGIGLLLQRDSGASFLLVASTAVVLFVLVPAIRRGLIKLHQERTEEPGPSDSPPAVPTSLLAGGLLLLAFGQPASAADANGMNAAEEIRQKWTVQHSESRLEAEGTVRLSGEPGDSFLLLRAPAILTGFEGNGLRLTRQEIPGAGLSYIITIPIAPPVPIIELDPFAPLEPVATKIRDFEAKFSYRLRQIDPAAGFAVPTGPAAIQQVEAAYDRAGWTFRSDQAIRVVAKDDDGGSSSAAELLLAPGAPAKVSIEPAARDPRNEKTEFYVETSNLHLPAPGVVESRHKIRVRPSRGLVGELKVSVPDGLTVGEVTGPIGSWQFDASERQLRITIDPPQPSAFEVLVEAQRGIAALPSDLVLEPLRVADAAGEVGFVAVAFGPDAQPERVESETLSQADPEDFDASLLPGEGVTLHRVYRHGTEGGELSVRVAPVAPEIRLTSKQVLSLGDERVVLAANFATEISRAGVFQLSLPLPDGFEIESLSGDALHHWSEVAEGDGDNAIRRIILHLNGKTIGAHKFSLALTAPAPEETDSWTIPRFELDDASRHTGELVVQPATGLRPRTISRQNASEVDPRSLGGSGEGALAFRLLQNDWEIVLGIEQLEPWVTGDVLHEISLREGQTRSALFGRIRVENASIRGLAIRLPLSDPEEIKTLRASGDGVGDIVRTAEDSDLWELQFERRIVGETSFRLEFERVGERESDAETLSPISLPDARQLSYHYAIRSGGRLEVETTDFPRGWQRADWNSVPQALRDAGNQTAPALTLRAVSTEVPMLVKAVRHSTADALKLRVAAGNLVTVLSPLGEQLTAVDLTMEVVQRSSLTVGLPIDGNLFNIFVNGESVHSVRTDGGWQFSVLPGTDDRTANVRFVYTVPGERLRRVSVASPQLDAPLENISWNVVAPKGYEMSEHRGDLELKLLERRSKFDKAAYLSVTSSKKEAQSAQAAEMLQQANEFLQDGDNAKAQWAFNNVYNQVGHGDALNEDARVQLENLQTQQAIVGLNTRQQRLYLDNGTEEVARDKADRLEAGMVLNRVLQEGDLNFRPQEIGQILQGNSDEDNAALRRMAERLVQHQRTTQPAPQAISVTLPEEGTAYTFERTVQVSENAPLTLDLEFENVHRASLSRSLILLLAIAAVGGMGAWRGRVGRGKAE